MAVFTSVTADALNAWLPERYALRRAERLAPISDGIENTNYRAVIDGGEYVFTIFELWDSAAAEYYAALMRHLAAAELPVPAAVAGRDGALCHDWDGKPCLLAPFAPGEQAAAPDAARCGLIGDMLARLHIAAAGFAPRRPNPRGGGWRRQSAEKVRAHLDGERQALLADALADDAAFCAAPLPAAACHCDLFRSNVLWEGERISAVIDFYFGGDDSLIFDLAVCVCDWCYCPQQQGFDESRLAALISGYTRRRRLCELEKTLFISALSAAATRFWLSRHYDLLFPRQAQRLTPHDPGFFEDILRVIRKERDSLTQLMLMQAAA